MTTEKHTVGNRTVRILLEWCLVYQIYFNSLSGMRIPDQVKSKRIKGKVYIPTVMFHLYNNRTGKRGILGLLKDGVNASHRYYINNFTDGWRQVKLPNCVHFHAMFQQC